MRPVPQAAADERWRPFCSERCRNEDLARWADGRYRVAGEPVPRPTATMPIHDSIRTDAPLSMADTLTITDNRTGKQYEIPINDGHDPRHRPAADQDRPGRHPDWPPTTRRS